MRPRLQDDVRYAPCPNGVYLHSSRASRVIGGTQAHAWLERLAPHLTGDRTLAELTARLPEAKRSLIEDLVGHLHRFGFVADVRGDEPHTLSPADQREYADEIAFIRYALDSAEHRFERHRTARIVLLGDEPLLSAVLRAGLRSGWGEVRVGVDPQRDAGPHAVVARYRRDPGQRVRIVAPDLNTLTMDPTDLVLQVTVDGDPLQLTELTTRCAASGATLGQLWVTGGSAWFSVLGPVDHGASRSAWYRLRGRRAGADAAATSLTGPLPMVLAHQLVLRQFRYSTGLDTPAGAASAPQQPRLTRIDLHTLAASQHRYLPHPRDALTRPVREADAAARYEALAKGEPLSVETVLEAASPAVDPRTGLLRTVSEEDYAQSPLWVCAALPSDPFSMLPARAAAPLVFGHGPDREDARLAAVLAGLAAYGSLAVDRRQLVRVTGEETVWGQDLITGAVRPVPAALAYPALGARWDGRLPTGCAAGLSWAEALRAGLFQHYERRLTETLASRAPAVPRWDVHACPLTERGIRLTRLVQAVDTPVVHNLSQLSGVPACAVRLGPDTVLAVGPTLAEAVSRGMERALLAWQSRTEGQPDYAPATIATIDDSPPTVVEPPATGVTRAPIGWPAAAAGLRAERLTPVAVALDHDRQATRLLPYLVQVVLIHE